MKNQSTRSVKTFLAMVLLISVFYPVLAGAHGGVDHGAHGNERTTTEDIDGVDSSVQTEIVQSRTCVSSARNGRCKQSIEYKSANLGKDIAGESDCKWSARKGRCNRVMLYKSVQVAYTNSKCKWSALKARCNKPDQSTLPTKVQVAMEKAVSRTSVRNGRCQQPIFSNPQMKVANSGC